MTRQAAQERYSNDMASGFESSSSPTHGMDSDSAAVPAVRQRGWLKMGAIAAASALAGGLAAAWFFRKTLAQLQQAENNGRDTGTGAPGSGFEEDV